MSKFYFTFGCGIDKPRRNCYTVIEADNWDEARNLMIDKFGKDWAFQYTENEWVYHPKDNQSDRELCLACGYIQLEPITQAKLFNLKEIK